MTTIQITQKDDLEKNIFDPKNPRQCKVYNLLLRIVKEGENIAYISPRFFFQIFQKHFEFIKRELWDPPDNFKKLNIFEKFECFESQFSFIELKQLINHAIVQDSYVLELFDEFFNLSLNRRANFDDIPLGIYYELLNKKHPITKMTKSLNERSKFSITLPAEPKDFFKNLVLFLDIRGIGFFKHVSPQRSSIIVTTIKEYNEQRFHTLQIENTHPLLLKDIKDVNLLLDVLYRDMQGEKDIILKKESGDISYLKNIVIKDYFCLKEGHIDDLENRKEIYITGENGDGKTLCLQALLLALKGNEDVGIVSDFIKTEKDNLHLSAADGNDKEYQFNPRDKQDDGHANIIAYGVHRHRNDSDRKDEYGYLTLFDPNAYLNNPTKWLQYLDYKKSRGEEDQVSLEVAKKMLNDILDENVDIEVSPDEVIFRERGTKIKFDQLSDGYKNVIIWVCDMIERLSKNQPHVSQLKDLRGIVLVDEIDLHLHPRWKYQIVRKLRGWFPDIQFIFTTHSPTVILGSSEDAVFYKVYKEDGVVRISKPLKSIKNLMANTVLTSPLFNLEQASAVNSDNDIDTSDGYLYSVIHKEIAKRIKNDNSITEDDILGMVSEELDAFEAGNDKSR